MEEQNIENDYDINSHETNAPADNNSSSSSGKLVDIQRLNHPTGVLTIINALLLFLGACIMGGWRSAVPGTGWMNFHNGSTFYLVSTVLPFVLLCVLILVYLFDLKKKFDDSTFDMVIFINCVWWTVLVVISSSIVLANADEYACKLWYCGHLKAAGAFGFLSAIGLTIKGIFNFLSYRRG